MPDDYIDMRSPNEEGEKPSEDVEKSSWWIGRWAHVIAGLVFCLLYFPFQGRLWSWEVSITLSYVVFMLCCTCGMAFRDSDDFFGNLEVSRYMAILLVRQAFVLALISIGAYLWHYLKSVLPAWVTEGRRLPLWDLCGLLLAYWAAIREASWMADKIKRRFPEPENEA
jgi:hypothetical protein